MDCVGQNKIYPCGVLETHSNVPQMEVDALPTFVILFPCKNC